MVIRDKAGGEDGRRTEPLCRVSSSRTPRCACAEADKDWGSQLSARVWSSAAQESSSVVPPVAVQDTVLCVASDTTVIPLRALYASIRPSGESAKSRNCAVLAAGALRMRTAGPGWPAEFSCTS
jgi:hypothetical protein